MRDHNHERRIRFQRGKAWAGSEEIRKTRRQQDRFAGRLYVNVRDHCDPKGCLAPGLVGGAESREETATGMRLRLPADVLSAILETVDAERKCCRFLQFEITVEPDGGPIWLELAGPPGTREFLSALLES